MNVLLDETGQPIIIVRDQNEKKRLKGYEAQKANILACMKVAETLKSSLGPRGMDKVIVSADGDVTVTNDGATILSQMEVEHQCAKLLVDLSKSQDAEIGDGTTGVVILAGALLGNALKLLDKKIHPLRIAEGYEIACAMAEKNFDKIATTVDEKNEAKFEEFLISAAMTSLSSKVVSSQQRHLAEICVKAVLTVSDRQRRDVNLDLIKVEGKPGGKLEETALIEGIVLDKELSHSQMAKETTDAKIAILTCAFEPPRPKTKHKLDIKNAEDCAKLVETEQQYFRDMVQKCVDAKANFIICQWGFDDEANHLLMLNKLPAVRWVGGVELELIAIATGGRIVPRFEDLTEDKLGRAASVKEITAGTEDERLIVISGCPGGKAVTIIVRGGNQMAVDEAKRCIHDALCVVRNLIKEPRIVPGGGAAEMSASVAIEDYLCGSEAKGISRYAIQAFADSLAVIPECLADNSGFNSMELVASLRAKQTSTRNYNLGIDCQTGTIVEMLPSSGGPSVELDGTHVHESLHSKRHQVALATQVVRMILKIDDVIAPQQEG